MKKILLLWYMEDDNFGDVLISETIKEYFEEYSCVFEDHEVGDNWSNIVQHANECDFLLFAGGGIIERWVPNIIANWQKVINVLRIPYGVIGLGIGEFNYEKYSDMFRLWVDNSKFFFVRDKYTQSKLNDYSFSKKVVFSADCVFANRFEDDIKCNIDKVSAINVRNLPYEDLTGKLDWLKVNKVIEELEIKQLIMDSSDESNSSSIFNQKEISNYNKLDKKEKIEKIIADIAGCKLLVAMRFHVILVAAKFGIPAISIRYCPKVKYLTEQLGIEDLSVSIEEIDSIPDKVNKLMKNKEFYQNTVLEKVEYFQRKSNQMFQNITTIIFEKN